MNMNPMMLMQLQQRLGLFQQDHPKVIPFMQAVGANAVTEGTVFAVKVTTRLVTEISFTVTLKPSRPSVLLTTARLAVNVF